MKLRFYLMVTTMLITSIVMAQAPQKGAGGKNPEEMVKRQTEEMVKELSLDAKQTEKVSEINKKYAEKMRAVQQSSKDDREGMREKMQKLRSEKETELKTVLTAEQFTKLKELEKKRIEDMRKRRQERGENSPERKERPRGTGDK